jgi:ferredoxin
MHWEGDMEQSTWLPKINRSLCTGCGQCISACPTQALRTIDNKASLAFPNACTYCAACEGLCPAGAIELPYLVCYSGVSDE